MFLREAGIHLVCKAKSTSRQIFPHSASEQVSTAMKSSPPIWPMKLAQS
jgi:hypothetical protein